MNRAIRNDLDRLAVAILRHLHTRPDKFDEREPLWMRREELRRTLP